MKLSPALTVAVYCNPFVPMTALPDGHPHTLVSSKLSAKHETSGSDPHPTATPDTTKVVSHISKAKTVRRGGEMSKMKAVRRGGGVEWEGPASV